MQKYLHARRRFLKPGECRGQYLRCVKRGIANVQLPILTASQSAHPVHGFIGLPQKPPHFLKEKFSFRCEHRAGRAAAQKVHADLVLQVPDLSAQRRLRDSKSCRGLGEVRGFADRQKVSQMPEFHGAILSYQKSIAAQQTWYWDSGQFEPKKKTN